MLGREIPWLKKVLLVLILSAAWFVWGDQINFELNRSTGVKLCQDFSSIVVLTKEIEQGKTIYLNGVLVNKSTIATVKHGGVDSRFLIYADNKLFSNHILKVTDDPSRDLSYITVREIPGMIPGKVSNRMIGPFILVTARNTIYTWLYPGNSWKIMEELLVFPNRAAEPGDSGAPLLNRDCEVVAIVHGGSHSYLWNLRPSSEYTPLINK